MGERIAFGASDARFEQARILSVYIEDSGAATATFVAAHAAVLSPLDPDADAGGWVTGLTEISGTFHTHPADPDKLAEAIARLERWRDEGTELRGLADIEHSILALKNPALPGDGLATSFIPAGRV